MTKELDSFLDELIQDVQKIDPVNSRKWFENLEIIKFDGGLLEIGCPDEGKAHFLKDNCSAAFMQVAQKKTGYLVSVNFTSSNGSPAAPIAQKSRWAVKLHPDYTFDSFVVGPGNRLAHASCVAVSHSPGDTYNPLFVYGPVGLGKTHLLHGICWEAKNLNTNVNIQFLTCEQFMNRFIRAIEEGNLPEFQNQLRSVDILVIDDIQFLREREQSQEEFFHTFNALYDNRKQIVLSADCAPNEIGSLEERLVSRFKWGLVTSVDAPSYETRVAIVQKKAHLRGCEISDEVAAYIAQSAKANIRELEGALTIVYATAKTTGQPINLTLAKQALGGNIVSSERDLSITDIIEATTKYFNVRRADLQSKKRSQSIALPRQICMYLARNMTRHSLEEIGGHLGGRDHTTVMHACSKITELKDKNEKIKNQLSEISSSVKNMSM